MSQSNREEYNELNRKAYGTNKVSQFENPNYQALSRMAVKQFLKFDPTKGSQIDDTYYTRESVGPSRSGFDNVNTNLWTKDGKVMDFACGVGLNTQEVLPYVGEVVGVDISQAMVDEYNSQSIFKGKAKSVMADVVEPETDLNSFGKFDQIFSSLAYHHIPDTHAVTDKLRTLLKDNGWLFVFEFDLAGEHENKHEDHEKHKELGVAHGHLNADDVAKIMTDAGLKNVSTLRGFKLELWYTNNDILKRMVEDPNNVPTRVNEQGETEHQRVLKLCVVAGQKVE